MCHITCRPAAQYTTCMHGMDSITILYMPDQFGQVWFASWGWQHHWMHGYCHHRYFEYLCCQSFQRCQLWETKISEKTKRNMRQKKFLIASLATLFALISFTLIAVIGMLDWLAVRNQSNMARYWTEVKIGTDNVRLSYGRQCRVGVVCIKWLQSAKHSHRSRSVGAGTVSVPFKALPAFLCSPYFEISVSLWHMSVRAWEWC